MVSDESRELCPLAHQTNLAMNENTITEVVKRIKRSDRLYQLHSYLKSQNLSDDEIESYIDAANNRIYESKLASLPKTKKIIFFVLVTIALTTLILFLFVLPSAGYKHTTILSIIGAIILSASLIYSWVYYKSWEKESIKQELEIKKTSHDGMSIFFIFIPIPAVIFAFIFSSILENGEDNLLKKTQVQAKGIIIAGSSNTIGVRRSDINFSSVTVEFQTKTGEKIRATEDVSEYEFKEFYEGQKVDLIYSSEDPQNIALLTNKSDIKKFKDSEERDFEAADLITLMISNDGEVLGFLNSISFGWVFDQNTKSYINESKQMIFNKEADGIFLVTGEISMYKFPKQFMELKFKDITEGGIRNPMVQRLRMLQNDQYVVTIERNRIEQQAFITTTLMLK